jgi:hypothetical protein
MATAGRLQRPTMLFELAEAGVAHGSERGCWLAQPPGSTEAPGARG